jgi:hypothetical protein
VAFDLAAFGGWINPEGNSTKPMIVALESTGDEMKTRRFPHLREKSLPYSVPFLVRDGM